MIEVYNSSEKLIFKVTAEEFKELKANHQINDSDRIVIK